MRDWAEKKKMLERGSTKNCSLRVRFMRGRLKMNNILKNKFYAHTAAIIWTSTHREEKK